MDINVLDYKPVIDKVLTKLKVKTGQKEDMTQECYIALLERSQHLENGVEIGQAEAYATSICTSRIWDIWKKENQQSKDIKNYMKPLLSGIPLNKWPLMPWHSPSPFRSKPRRHTTSPDC